MEADSVSAERSLRSEHEAAGARFQELRGVEVPRHYGDPRAEYRVAVEKSAVIDRSHRGRWRMTGRDPARMLDGLVTNGIPAPVETIEEQVTTGRGGYGAILTPKGKMVTDHRLFRWGGDEENEFLLDLPPAGVAAAEDHFRRFVPPRFAKVEDVTAETGMLTVVGPDAADVLSREALGLRVETAQLEQLAEDEFFLVGPNPAEGIRVARSGSVRGPAFDLLADAATIGALWRRLVASGSRPVGFATWETLRVEAGRPAFGTDMDGGTIPVEAGIHDRAIDYEKGCYTGQEVIVRIRDRGRVNRHLRGLLLGDGPAPPAGTELFVPDRDRPVGELTSVVRSPRFGQSAGLGYVRREVAPPAEARLGSVDGPVVKVREIGAEGWSLGVEGSEPEGSTSTA